MNRYFILTICLAISFVTAQSQDLTDDNIKRNIMPIQNPMKQLALLDAKVFEYNTGEYKHLSLPAGSHYGFIAEEFQQVFPALVHRKPYSYMSGKNSYRNVTIKSINLEGLIPVLIASIKEQQIAIEELREEIEALKKR